MLVIDHIFCVLFYCLRRINYNIGCFFFLLLLVLAIIAALILLYFADAVLKRSIMKPKTSEKKKNDRAEVIKRMFQISKSRTSRRQSGEAYH